MLPFIGLSQEEEEDTVTIVNRSVNWQRDIENAIKIKDKRKRNLGKKHPHYASSLYGLANLYRKVGDYAKAEPLYREAKTIWEQAPRKENPNYVKCLRNYANMYVEMGDYYKAEPLYIEAKTIIQKSLRTEHSNYRKILNSLADLYTETGNYEEALIHYLEVKAIMEKAPDKEPLDYAHSLDDVANIYSKMGNYEEVESLSLESKDIKEKILGKQHLDYARSLDNLANLYRKMGNYKAAEPFLLESKNIKEIKLGKEHSYYAATLNSLAVLYMEIGDYNKAERLFLDAKTIRGKQLGYENPDYAASLNDLAILYIKMGKYEEAEDNCLQAKAIREKVLGKEHPDYAHSLNVLANLYRNMGKYKEAEPLYINAKAIREKILGKVNINYIRSLNDLAILYMNIGNYQKAEPLFEELAHLNQSLISRAIHHLSERELNIYLNTFSKSQAQLLSFAQIPANKDAHITSTCFDNVLFYKGFLLNTSNRIKQLALSPALGGITTEKFNQLKSIERRLAAEYSKPITERKNVSELEAKVNDIEKELARTVAGYGEAMRQVRWQEVQQKLKPGEAAVEFIHYRCHDKKKSDSTMYAALVLRPGDEAPQFLPLFEERDIAPLLKNAKGINIRGINDLYSVSEQMSLYDLIWRPLDGLLQGTKTVYCSPSGLLHRLNLGAIPIDGQQTFGDKHQLVLLNSTRQLVIPNIAKNAGNTAYIVGGVRYEMDSSAIAPVNTDFATRSLSSPDELPFHTDSTSRGGSWNYLPGTATEALDINRILRAAHLTTQLDTGYLAIEEAFRSLGMNEHSPRILHIATHGFFFPDPKESVSSRQSAVGIEPVFKISDNPMIRSGLILAGAQQVWATGKAPENREDGILTAYEISQINLSNTELVVLSACETGLGDIEGNEGVYGLQRAFKIAGAKYLIMSLWKVNDLSTREFMTEFYRQWLDKGMTIPAAFRTAQANMKAKYVGSPFLWAGFVLVE